MFVSLFVFYFKRGRRTPNELGIERIFIVKCSLWEKKNISLRPHSIYAGAQGPRSHNRDVGTVYFDLDTVATPKKKVPFWQFLVESFHNSFFFLTRQGLWGPGRPLLKYESFVVVRVLKKLRHGCSLYFIKKLGGAGGPSFEDLVLILTLIVLVLILTDIQKKNL